LASDEIRIISTTCTLTVLNMGYKHDLIHLKEFVFWHLTFSLSVTKPVNMTKQRMKFVYWYSTYILPILNMDLKRTCTKSRYSCI